MKWRDIRTKHPDFVYYVCLEKWLHGFVCGITFVGSVILVEILFKHLLGG